MPRWWAPLFFYSEYSRFYFLSPSRSMLPFSPEDASFYNGAEAAVDVVERACRLCADLKRASLSNDGRILEKNDQTPVTIADFSVQALLSLEEDSTFLSSGSVNSQNDGSYVGDFLVDSVVSAVADKV